MLFLLFLLISLVFGDNHLLKIPSNQGYLSRTTAQVGTPIEFDGPLIVNKKLASNVELNFENQTNEEIFGIFPSKNVSSGRKFGIFVKNPTLLPTNESFVNLTLIASNGKQKDQQVKLFIKLEDKKLEAPELDSLEYNIYVGELNTPRVLKKFKIRNAHRTRPTNFVYKLTGKHSNLFSVDPVDPDQILLQKIGCNPSSNECPTVREDVFPLLLTVFCNHSNVLPAKTLFIIRKSSLPMMAQFKNALYNFTIKEHEQHFEELARVGVEDERMENAYFQLDASENVEINARSGVLSVKKPLTQREFGNSTTFNVQLRSIANQSEIFDEASIRVKIERSDRLPVGKSLHFEQKIYAFALTPGQSKIGQVRVQTPMEMIHYRIVEGGANEIEIDERNGNLSYVEQQFSQSKNYILKVIAIAGDQTDLCSVQILVAGLGSTTPIFPIQFFDMEINPDELLKKTNIHTFKAKDADNDAKLQYKMSGIECFDLFGQKAPNECLESVKVETNGTVFINPIVRTTKFSTIQLTILCNDTQHPIEAKTEAQLIIHFKRNKPNLTNQTLQFHKNMKTVIKLPRNLIPGSYAGKTDVQQLEKSGKGQQNVNFELDQNSMEYFSIDAITGILTTKMPLKNAPTTFNITISATNLVDSTHNSINITIQLIEINKNGPSFAQEFMEFQLPSDSQKGRVLGSVKAISRPDSQMEYKLIGDLVDYFNISGNGKITLTDHLPEITFGKRQLNLFASATNSNMTCIIPIYVHLIESVNEVPKFAKTVYNLKLMENAPVGTFITKFQHEFSSHNYPTLKYSIQPSNTQSSKLTSLLAIDQNGILKTSGMLHDLNGNYIFTVFANSGDRNESTTVNLQILSTLNCQPKFMESQPTVLYLNSTTSKTSLLGKFFAETQTDCELVYELENPYLKIDNLTGEVHIRRTLENIGQHRFPLVVKARSGNLLTRLSAELRVGNNRIPKLVEHKLHYQISENSKTDTTIGWLMMDSECNGKFRLNSSDFTINSTSGQLKTRHSLDREKQSRHEFGVEVIDPITNEVIDKAMVIVDVLDVNDNAPHFQKYEFELVVDKKTMPGQVVFDMQAIDPDSSGGEQKKLIYRLESQLFYYVNKNKVNSDAFEIADPTRGQIILQKSISDVGGIFELVLVVSDLTDDITHMSRATIKIWICESSDIGKFILNQNARDIQHESVKKYISDLEKVLQARPILKDVKYHATKRGPDSNSVILEILFVHPRTQKIVPFARIEKQLVNSELNELKILNNEIAEELSSSELPEDYSSVNTASLLIAAVIFCVLLCIVLAVFVAIIYSHKRKFNRHKRLCEGMKAVVESSNKHVHSQFNDPPSYKLVGETQTRVNPMLMQEIEDSMTHGGHLNFRPGSRISSGQNSIR